MFTIIIEDTRNNNVVTSSIPGFSSYASAHKSMRMMALEINNSRWAFSIEEQHNSENADLATY